MAEPQAPAEDAVATPDHTLPEATEPGGDATLEQPGVATPRSPLLGEGTTVGHFRLGRVLGEGGMGVVHEAYDADLDRTVAIKLVRDRAAGTAAGRNLIREAQAMARLAHPGVVAVHEVGTVDDQVFVVMERVAGGSLDRYLAAAPRTWRTIVGRFIEAGEGLAAAHRAGLVHRDFKPSNVLLDEHGRAKVGDFGIVRLATGREPRDATGSGPRSALGDTVAHGAAVGTPAYMAPEQARGEAVDARADQYAFAVALHEALFGALPGAPPRTGGAGGGALDRARIPGAIRRALTRALADDPAARWPSMAVLVARLRRGLRSRRQLAAGIAAVTALAIAAAGVARWTTPTRLATCDDGGGLVDEVWGAARQRQIAAAFAATGRPHAATTTRTTLRTVDDWAAGWQLGRRAACHAEPAMRAARVGCLDRQLAFLRAQVAQWAAADGEATDRAIAAATALPQTEACAATAIAPSPTSAPLFARIAELTVLERAGRTTLARPRIAALLADAERAGDPTALAQARDVAAEIESSAGDPERARELEVLAARSAAAAGDDRLMLRSLLASVAASVDAGHAREALAALDAAEPLAVRAHLDDLDGTIALRRGEALTHAGDLPAALVALGRAVTLAEQRTAREPSTTDQLALALALEASADIAAHDFARARALLERTLALEESFFGHDHPEVAKTLHDLAVTEYRLDDVASSRAHFARAQDILTRTYGPNHPLLAKLHLSLGSLAIGHGDPTTALAEYQLALAAMRASLPPDHPDLASAEMNLASALRELDRCAEAVPHSQRALAILDHLHKTGPDLAQAELTFGMCQSDLHHDREATELLRNVLAEYERAGLHGDDLAEPLAGLAELAYRGGHHAEGIEFINRSLAVIGTPRPETQQLHDYLTAELATWRKAR